VKIRTVTSLREFDQLAAVWRDITDASGQRSPFVSHDWFASCWRTAGPHCRREVWVVEDAAGPLAIIPLLYSRAWYRGFPSRTLQLMHAPGMPTADLPVARAFDEVAVAFLDHLRSRHDWDLFVMPGLSAESSTWKAFESAVATRNSWRVANRIRLPYVQLSERDPSLRAMLDGLRGAVASSQSRGSVPVVVEEHRDLDVRGPLFDEIMGVLRPRRHTIAGMPAPNGEDVRRFLRELTPRAGSNGWLSLWVLRFGGLVVETEYQLVADGRVHALRRDADQTLPALRLGDVLTLSILEALVRRPTAHIYHPAPGYDDAPSTPWGHSESLFVEVFSPRSYGDLLHRLETRILPLAWSRRSA
jgi:GNAT acetyltransferase-like protein